MWPPSVSSTLLLALPPGSSWCGSSLISLRHASRQGSRLQGPTMRRCSELLAEERPAPQGGPQPQRRTQRPWPRRSQFGIRGHGHDTVNSRTGGSTGMAKNRSLPAAQPPSCDRNINTVLAQKCKSRDAGCYRTMTARQEMSHRLLKASQHSRSRDCDRKSDIPEPT